MNNTETQLTDTYVKAVAGIAAHKQVLEANPELSAAIDTLQNVIELTAMYGASAGANAWLMRHNYQELPPDLQCQLKSTLGAVAVSLAAIEEAYKDEAAFCTAVNAGHTAKILAQSGLNAADASDVITFLQESAARLPSPNSSNN